MANIQYEEKTSTASLIGNVLENSQKLLKQELSLAKSELRTEWTHAKRSFQISFAALFSASLGVVFLSLSIIYLLVELGLPWWISYGVLAIFYSAVGIVLYFWTGRRASKISLVPRETMESMRESIEWIRKPQLSSRT